MFYSQSALLIGQVVVLLMMVLRSANTSPVVFLYNSIAHCKSADFFDVEQFKCRPCNSTVGLMPADSREYKIIKHEIDILYICDTISQHSAQD